MTADFIEEVYCVCVTVAMDLVGVLTRQDGRSRLPATSSHAIDQEIATPKTGFKAVLGERATAAGTQATGTLGGARVRVVVSALQNSLRPCVAASACAPPAPDWPHRLIRWGLKWRFGRRHIL
jgi:hypothetical protein